MKTNIRSTINRVIGILSIASVDYFAWKDEIDINLLILFSVCGTILLVIRSKPVENFWGGIVLDACYAFVFADITYFLSQYILQSKNEQVTYKKMVLGVVVCAAVYYLLNVIFDSMKFSISIGSFLLLLLAAANHYVYQFRGVEFSPTDFYSVQTAQNVLSEYELQGYENLYFGLMLFLSALFVFWCFPSPAKEWTGLKSRGISLAAGLMLSVVIAFSAQDIGAAHWANEGTAYNGYLLNFTLQLKEAFITKPDGYSDEMLAGINEAYEPEKDNKEPLISGTEAEEETENYPTIICIMNESLTDFASVGEINANQKLLPYLSSLTEDTIKGYALASVFGGGTANSEYEFLTGNSMAFLPEGSVAYQQYMQNQSYSLVSYLNSLGYESTAMHPYFGNGYSRNTVYPALGFEAFYTLEHYDTSDAIRGLVSDHSMYQKLESIYEYNKANTNAPQFIWGVTMQNHGGYGYDWGEVKLEGYSSDYPDAEFYLSLANESDAAFRELTDYFSNVDEDVVILMFGDHYPNISADFYKEVYGDEIDDFQEQFLEYEVPFWIWTNYDIEEEEGVNTSLNFLSNYIFKAADMELPPYNQFLSDIATVVPVINSHGYYSLTNGEFMKIEDAAAEEAEAINRYNIVQYNNIFSKAADKLDMFRIQTPAEAVSDE